MKRRKWTWTALCMAGTVMVFEAQGQGTTEAAQTVASGADSEVVELSEFIVSGEVYTFGAQKIVYVGEEELSLLQAVDLKDIFAYDPSIQVGGGTTPAEKIYIRGIEDKLLNITIDGAPQGGYLSHHQSQYLIDPELLKRVEVEPGPGGAVQGAGALAGSIRFVTKGPEDFLQGDRAFGGLAKTAVYTNADGNNLTGVLAARLNEDASVMAAFTFLDTGDYVDGNGDTVEYTGHEQWRLFLKGDTQLGERQRLGVSYEHIEDSGWYRHRPNFYGYFNHPVAPNIPVDMTFGRDTLTVNYENRTENAGTIQADFYYTDNSVDRKGQYEMSYSSIGGDIRDRLKLDNHDLTFGFDFREDTMEFTGKGSAVGFVRPIIYTTIPDESVLILGAYAQDNWSVNDRLQLSYGARADYYDYEDKDGQTYEDAGLSPNVGLSYLLYDGFRLNASYGLAFRGVTVIDAITANEGTVTNAEEIDPERAENMELGFQYEGQPFSISGTVYKQTIDDVIAGTDPRDNNGELEAVGYDLSVLFNLGNFQTTLSVSETDLEHNGQPILDISNGLGVPYGRTWNGILAYNFSQLNLTTGWTVQLTEAYDETPAGTVNPDLYRKASYTIHGLYVQWKGLENDQLQVTLTVDNIFDKYYVSQATSGYNAQIDRIAGLAEPGRDVRLSVSYLF